MILSGNEIQRQLGTNIKIDPFDERQLNPNSYNLRLHDELLVYDELELDMRRPAKYRRVPIPPEGIVLQPNRLYLGRTVERTETHNYVPMLEGRSSIGRLGIDIHATAGKGDVGFCNHWTLEISVKQPIRVYAGMPVGQLIYFQTSSPVTVPYNTKSSAKYNERTDRPVESMMWKNFEDKLFIDVSTRSPA